MLPITMGKPPEALLITPEQRLTLETWMAAGKTPQRVALRARIVLLAAAGAARHRIAHELPRRRPKAGEGPNQSQGFPK